MKIRILRSIAVGLGVSVSAVAQAQSGGLTPYGEPYVFGGPSYQAATPGQADLPSTAQLGAPTYSAGTGSPPGSYQPPAKWSHFNRAAPPPAATPFQAVANKAQGLPSPAARYGMSGGYSAEPIPAPLPERSFTPGQITGNESSQFSETTNSQLMGGPDGVSGLAAQESPYQGAMQSSWDGCVAVPSGLAAGRPLLSPWFGGFNILFLDVENDGDYRLVHDDADASTSYLWSSAVDPASAVGYELSLGRYLACGKYAIGFTYFNFDPDSESTLATPGSAGDYMASVPGWNNASVDPSGGGNPAGVGNGGLDTVYTYYNEAAGYRARRDLDFQGIELGFSCFGIMGAQRAASCSGTGLLSLCGKLGQRLGLHAGSYSCCADACGPATCGPTYGFGGAGGPLVRPCSGRVQVVASHGFRWFQFEDSFGFDANIDGTAGYQPTDLFYDIDTENNLYGYQFGSRLNYCLCNRLNLSVGGKFGIYGNDVEYRQRLGTAVNTAYYTDFPTDLVDTESSDTVLSTLGELDLGLGYRLCSAWTIRGGYRLIGVTGVATSVGSLSNDYASVAPNSRVYADDSIIIQGGYVGAEYNW